MSTLSYFADNYIKDLMLLMSFAALMMGLFRYRRQPELRIFFFYTLFSLLTDLMDVYRVAAGPNARFAGMLEGWANLLFTIYEYVLFLHYIYLHVSGVLRRRTIKILGGIYLGYLLLSITLFHKLLSYQSFYFLESVFITIPCLLYFYELFVQTPESPLKTKPSFWIITGILLLNCGALPLYVVFGSLGKYLDSCYNLVFLLYTSLFCLIIRAYLCQPGAILYLNKPLSRENYFLFRR
jgi:hypothetical protein